MPCSYGLRSFYVAGFKYVTGVLLDIRATKKTTCDFFFVADSEAVLVFWGVDLDQNII